MANETLKYQNSLYIKNEIAIRKKNLKYIED